jgi:hypothetical protein
MALGFRFTTRKGAPIELLNVISARLGMSVETLRK